MERTKKKKMPRRKLAWKMFGSYIAASLLPFAMIVTVFLLRTVESTERNLIQMAEPYCEQMIEELVSCVQDVEEEIAVLKDSNYLSTMLFTEYLNQSEAIVMYQSQWESGARMLISEDHTVRLYNTPKNSNIAALLNNTLEDFKRIYGEEALLTYGSIHCKMLPRYGILPQRLAFYTSYAGAGRQMFLTIEVPFDLLIPSLENSNSHGGYTYLLDGDGTILFSNDMNGIYTENIRQLIAEERAEDGKVYLNDESCLSIVKSLSDYSNLKSDCADWKLLYLMPNELFSDSMRENILFVLPLCLLSLLLSTVVAIAFTRWICGRLEKLRSKTNRILKQDFDIAEPVTNNDELGDLESAIYEMASALEMMFFNQKRQLEQENAQKIRNEQLLRATTEAEIKALRYQINPHYLFNTMESIRMHLFLQGDTETAHIIRLFSESFRKMLETERTEYTLADELETIESYIQVQKYRLGDRFTSAVQADPAIGNCRFPKLLIQPLLENAFFHGIELSENHGLVQVKITLQGNCLNIRVTDNGIGMPAQKLEQLRSYIRNPDSASRVGLMNIVKRLNLLYGNAHRFEIESEEGVGTTIDVTIPYQPLQKEETIV